MFSIFHQGSLYVILLIYLWIVTVLESSYELSKWKRILCITNFVILSLFIGLRWETGTDWFPYKELFDTIELSWKFLLDIYHFDLGYVLLNAAVRIISDNYTVFLIINSGITIYFLTKLILKISPRPNLSLFFFYPTFMVAQFMGSNRRMMAMVGLLWAFYFLYLNKKKIFYILVSIAFMFHRSSVFGCVALFIPRKSFKIKTILLLLLVSFIIGQAELPAKILAFLGEILSSFISHPLVEKLVFYSEEGEEHIAIAASSLFIATLLAILKRSVLLLFYFYTIKKYQIDKLTQYIFNMYICAFAGYLMLVGSFFQMLTAYFALIEIILVARMFYYHRSRVKLLLFMILLIYGFIQMGNALNVYPELYMPYISIFSDIQR